MGYRYNGNNQTEAEKDSTIDSEEPENLVFFYHPDHLGSTSYVTDADGNIATDYDWNGAGVGHRNSLIQWERNRKELDDRHGFKVFYYGVGKLNK